MPNKSRGVKKKNTVEQLTLLAPDEWLLSQPWRRFSLQ